MELVRIKKSGKDLGLFFKLNDKYRSFILLDELCITDDLQEEEIDFKDDWEVVKRGKLTYIG